MTARPSVFFRTPLTCIPAAILRRTDGAGRWCRRRCDATTRDNARRGAIYDAQCRNGTTRPWHCVGRCTRWCRQIAILRRSSGRHKCRPYGAGYSSAESRQSSYGRGMFVRGIAADRRGGRGGAGGGAARRRATMHVGAPFMTPGAGTARPVRGIALDGVRGGAGKLRYCGGHPGDTSVAPTLQDVRP